MINLLEYNTNAPEAYLSFLLSKLNIPYSVYDMLNYSDTDVGQDYWLTISQYKYLPIYFIGEYFHLLDKVSIIKTQKLTRSFIEDHIKQLDLFMLAKEQDINIEVFKNEKDIIHISPSYHRLLTEHSIFCPKEVYLNSDVYATASGKITISDNHSKLYYPHMLIYYATSNNNNQLLLEVLTQCDKFGLKINCAYNNCIINNNKILFKEINQPFNANVNYFIID